MATRININPEMVKITPPYKLCTELRLPQPKKKIEKKNSVTLVSFSWGPFMGHVIGLKFLSKYQ